MSFAKATIKKATALYRGWNDELASGVVPEDIEPAVRKNVSTVGNLLMLCHRQRVRIERLKGIEEENRALRQLASDGLMTTLHHRRALDLARNQERNARRDFLNLRDENTLLRDIIEAHGLDVDILVNEEAGEDIDDSEAIKQLIEAAPQ